MLVNRKRPIDATENISSKQPWKTFGTQQYAVMDKPPYIVHVKKEETEKSSGTFLHPNQIWSIFNEQ